MGFLSRFFGIAEKRPGPPQQGSLDTDARALERYRYLLRTAPPDAIEQAHAEAFAQLTPEQRAQALNDLSGELPPEERATGAAQTDPKALARTATRAELRQPGTLERAFGGRGPGGALGGSLLSSLAGAFIGSAIAHQLFAGLGEAPAEGGEPREADSSGQTEDPSALDGGAEDGDFGDVGDFGD